MITEKTSFIGKFKGTALDLINQFSRVNTSKTDRAKRIAPIYIKYGELFNLRADLAWAQMEHETGFLEFKGDVKPHQNNFVGIGATGGVPGNSFATEELGVIAHYAHLAWYYFKDHVNAYCSNKYDPRHFGSYHYKYTGNTSLAFLSGQWAVPGIYKQPDGTIITYSGQIAKLANQVFIDNKVETQSKPEYYDLILQMGHVGRTSGATGTNGEQAFTKELGYAINHQLKNNSKFKVRLMGADDWLPIQPNKCKIFFSLHADGSLNKSARGFSLGYKPGSNPTFAHFIAESYKKLTGFNQRNDNYTSGLTNYYAWTLNKTRRIHRVEANYYCLLEHGFLTNDIERSWLFNNIAKVAEHHAKRINEFLLIL